MASLLLTMSARTYAHSLPNAPQSDWEDLEAHLKGVAILCAEFASSFGVRDWGYALGRCHDLGKASREFQARLLQGDANAADLGAFDQVAGRVDHSTYGAKYLRRLSTELTGLCGWLLAYAVAGHHAGLANWSARDDQDRSTLPYRLSDRYRIPVVSDPEVVLGAIGLPWTITALPRLNSNALRRAAFSYALFTRMVFSCLIDADRLCTEAFCDASRAEERREARPSLAEMQLALDSHLRVLQDSARASAVNAARRVVLEQCCAAATAEPGFFSLQVPTGGGKTLASLAFALRHALHVDRSRVIVAIPFTSIIEQTADVYRDALGELGVAALVEHHTNLQPHRDTRANQFAVENWDAPLIVTTNVQLFESLFASRTTPCRKLHRLAHSVIILDEAQSLPADLLQPTLSALRELVEHYGCSIVLCTATQPALEARDDLEIGIEGVRPIIADAKPIFESLRRVRVESSGAISDDELAERLGAEPRVLCIVNTRRHAYALFNKLQIEGREDECFHLSTLMCGAHRRAVLKRVRQQLATAAARIRLISTQLVEAGVDVDFPVVYRAAAGLDSIAQAAGRCNREGRLPLGLMYIFDPAEGVPPGFLRQSAEVGREILKRHTSDPLSPEAIHDYFRQLYWRRRDQWDAHGIMSMTNLVVADREIQPQFDFRRIEDQYKLIRDEQLPILIPFDSDAQQYSRQLSNGEVECVAQRKLQPYLVSVPRRMFDGLVTSGIVLEHDSGVGLLLREDVYHAVTGLRLDAIGLDPMLWGL